MQRSRTNWPLRGSAKHRARGHVELAAVTSTCHHSPGQMTLGERTAHVRASVVERVEMIACTRDIHVRSRDIEDAHLARFDIVRASNSYRHRVHLPKRNCDATDCIGEEWTSHFRLILLSAL